MPHDASPSAFRSTALSGVGLLLILLSLPAIAAPHQHATTRPTTQPATAGEMHRPIPDEGETITAPIPPRVLGDQTTPVQAKAGAKPATTRPAATQPSGEIVHWGLAGKHVGETITVEGKIVDTHSTGSVCFLNFSRDRGGTFYVILFEEVLKAWPAPPQDYFLNKTIKVTGQVYMQKGRPQIRVREAEQIVVEWRNSNDE